MLSTEKKPSYYSYWIYNEYDYEYFQYLQA